MQKHDKFDILISNMNIRSLDMHCGEFQTMPQNFNFKLDIIMLSELVDVMSKIELPVFKNHTI